MADLGKSIFKISSGLLFNDEYNSVSARWITSPPGSYSIVDRPGFLRLSHHPSIDTLMLTDIPNVPEFAFEVKADFTPTVEGDNGGLMIWKNSTEKTEFLEGFDALRVENQTSWLAVKSGDSWVFYSDEGTGYNFVDSEYISGATKFGVVLKRGSDPAFTNLDVDKMTVTLGDKLIVRNVAIGATVRLKDTLGEILAQDIISDASGAILKMPKLEIDGILEVLDDTGTLVTQVPTIFHGGDVYSLGTEVEIRYLGEELSRTAQTHLGSMPGGLLEISLEVYNPSTFSATNVKISIEQYLSKFGWTWAEVAHDSAGVPGTYSNEITIPDLAPVTPYKIWMKVTKGNDYMGLEPLQFNVHMIHD